MTEAVHSRRLVRFGSYEVDLPAGELKKCGVKLKLSGQPFQVLAILLEQPGVVVTREELQKRLWPDTFVDVDHNLNTAINKIREALGDSSENPRFVETLPRRGYRFIAPVTLNGTAEVASPTENRPASAPEAARTKRLRALALLAAVVLLGPEAYGFSSDATFVQPHRSARSRELRLMKVCRAIPLGHPTDGTLLTVRTAVGSSTSGCNAVTDSRLPPESALYIVPASGGAWTRITNSKNWDDKPRWSPDGRTIYFVSRHGGFNNLWGSTSIRPQGKLLGSRFRSRTLKALD